MFYIARKSEIDKNFPEKMRVCEKHKFLNKRFHLMFVALEKYNTIFEIVPAGYTSIFSYFSGRVILSIQICLWRRELIYIVRKYLTCKDVKRGQHKI